MWPSVTMRMRGHPNSHLHDVAGAITSAERQTPLIQKARRPCALSRYSEIYREVHNILLPVIKIFLLF